jgi:hypothetical protein
MSMYLWPSHHICYLYCEFVSFNKYKGQLQLSLSNHSSTLTPKK